MTFTFRQAEREKIGLLFGVAGPSGSGKTRSALHLAKGIANGTGKIGFIDTEAGRALHYAPKPGEKADSAKGTFDFLHLDFPPPFTPERYVEAIKVLEGAGATVIIIDSMSHEWNGEGGCSDIAEAAATAAATDASGNFNAWKFEAMTAPSWKKPKLRHKRMMARLIQSRTHLIFCLRAEEKIKFKKVPGANGREKTEIEQLGFMPICEKAFMFELSGSMTMHPDTKGEPRYDLQHKLNDELQTIFPPSVRIGDEAGKRLREWADSGTVRAPADKLGEDVRDLVERIHDATTRKDLEAVMAGIPVAYSKQKLGKTRPELVDRIEEAVTQAFAVFDGASDEEEAA